MRTKDEQLHFLFSLTLLTLKEEESFKRIINKDLQSVRKRVNLALFGFDQTRQGLEESKPREFDTALYLLVCKLNTGIRIELSVNPASGVKAKLTHHNKLHA